MTALDPRLTAAGLTITVRQLIHLWGAHYPTRTPIPLVCPGCGHTYTPDAPLCPTAAVVRPLLQRRRHEVTPEVLMRSLTFIQYRDLLTKPLATATDCVTRPRTADSAAPVLATPGLFDVTVYRTGGAR